MGEMAFAGCLAIGSAYLDVSKVEKESLKAQQQATQRQVPSCAALKGLRRKRAVAVHDATWLALPEIAQILAQATWT